MAGIFRTPVAAMNDAQKEWFASALVSMVLADGDVSAGEVESLMASLSFLKSTDALDRLKKYIQYKTVPVLPNFIGWERHPERKASMLVDLIHVGIADRELSPKEQRQFHHIGGMLGFSKDKVELVLQKGIRVMAQMGEAGA